MRTLCFLGLSALGLAAGCSADNKSMATAAPDARTDQPPQDASALQDAEVPDTAAAQVTCDSGPDCTSKGEQAFDAQRYIDARALFERACERNDGAGCTSLALSLIHPNDSRIPAQPERVVPAMSKACELGDFEACRLLGNGYLYGRRSGVETADPGLAVKYFQKGCDGGEAGSCDVLASCYDDGMGVAKNKKLAKKYRKKAAELGFVGE